MNIEIGRVPTGPIGSFQILLGEQGSHLGHRESGVPRIRFDRPTLRPSLPSLWCMCHRPPVVHLGDQRNTFCTFSIAWRTHRGGNTQHVSP